MFGGLERAILTQCNHAAPCHFRKGKTGVGTSDIDRYDFGHIAWLIVDGMKTHCSSNRSSAAELRQ